LLRICLWFGCFPSTTEQAQERHSLKFSSHGADFTKKRFRKSGKTWFVQTSLVASTGQRVRLLSSSRTVTCT
jgi:hypothetical protein